MDQYSLDHLNETEFEQFCYDLLVELSFSNINWRKGTGLTSSPSDRGRDIECERVVEDIDGEIYLETWFVARLPEFSAMSHHTKFGMASFITFDYLSSDCSDHSFRGAL